MKAIKSAMPVLIETGSEEWPYAVRGTFFVVEVAGDMYVVTARHVVEGNSATSVFFRYGSGSRYSLPLNQAITIKEYAGSDGPECADVILYRIAVDEVTEPFVNAKLDEAKKPWSQLTKGDSLIFRGYPSELQEVEDNGLKEQGVVLDAKYLGPGKHPGCHEIELFPTELFTFHDGFSGSPVFLLKNGATQLVGLLVKASSYQNRALFVDGSVIYAMASG